MSIFAAKDEHYSLIQTMKNLARTTTVAGNGLEACMLNYRIILTYTD